LRRFSADAAGDVSIRVVRPNRVVADEVLVSIEDLEVEDFDGTRPSFDRIDRDGTCHGLELLSWHSPRSGHPAVATQREQRVLWRCREILTAAQAERYDLVGGVTHQTDNRTRCSRQQLGGRAAKGDVACSRDVEFRQRNVNILGQFSLKAGWTPRPASRTE